MPLGLWRGGVLLRPCVRWLAGRLGELHDDMACGPVEGGALLAYSVAGLLGMAFLAAKSATTRRISRCASDQPSHNVDMTTAQVTHLGSNAADITLGLIVGFVVVAGVVVAFGRWRLEGSFKARSGSSQGRGPTGQATPDRTFMRSWLAISLVGGLLIFSAVSFQLDDTTLRSTLLGGVVASAGAATAFYFASKSADQARQDILNASFPTATAPNLLGQTRSEVNAALAGTPLYLDASPTTADNDWYAVSQDPQPNQQTPTGSRVHVVFAGTVPDLNTLTITAAQTALSGFNLVLAANPSNPAAGSTARADQKPIAGSPPPPDRTVTVTFG